MKKTFTILFLAALILGACATVPRTALSPDHVSDLTGRWEGARDMLWGKYRSYDYTVLEIDNNTIPLRGTIKISFMQEADPRVYTFENGIIDGQGNLMVQLQQDIKFILSLYREEKSLKLDGNYLHRGHEGRLTLYKK